MLGFSAEFGPRLSHVQVQLSFSIPHEPDCDAVAHCTCSRPYLSRCMHERMPLSSS